MMKINISGTIVIIFDTSHHFLLINIIKNEITASAEELVYEATQIKM